MQRERALRPVSDHLLYWLWDISVQESCLFSCRPLYWVKESGQLAAVIQSHMEACLFVPSGSWRIELTLAASIDAAQNPTREPCCTSGFIIHPITTRSHPWSAPSKRGPPLSEEACYNRFSGAISELFVDFLHTYWEDLLIYYSLQLLLLLNCSPPSNISPVG